MATVPFLYDDNVRVFDEEEEEEENSEIIDLTGETDSEDNYYETPNSPAFDNLPQTPQNEYFPDAFPLSPNSPNFDVFFIVPPQTPRSLHFGDFPNEIPLTPNTPGYDRIFFQNE